MPRANPVAAIAAALMLGLALPAFAEDVASTPPPTDRTGDQFAAWAKGEIDRLNQEVDKLKAQLAEMSKRAGPALDSAKEGLDRAQSKFEAERPELESAGAKLWEKMRSTAATVGDELRQTWDRVEEKLSDRR